MVLLFYRDGGKKQVWGWHLFSRDAPFHVLHPRRNDRYRNLRGKATKSDCGVFVRKVKYSWLLHYTGTLFYLTIVTNQFLSTRLTYKIYTSNEKHVRYMWRLCEPKETIPAPCLNTGSKNLTLTALHWIKACGHRLTADWNRGEHCVACRQAKRTKWRMKRLVR
jgi:hypothetical protein